MDLSGLSITSTAFDCGMHPPLHGCKGMHAGSEDFVLDDDGGPPDFLYVVLPTAVESDQLPDLES